jgi:alkylation response protein AidB-like acyl-CoA dehydrogenase
MTLTAAPDLVDTATSFVEEVRQRAPETESSRRVPPDLIERMAAAGLFHAFVPQGLGGGEVHPSVFFRTVETLSAADGSTGWVVMIGGTGGVIAGSLPQAAAREIYGDRPGRITAGVVAPKGRAVPEAGGYRVDGQWPFASGCDHSEWIGGTCLVADEQTGAPDARFIFFPRSEVEILDTWYVSGLRGTGSHDIAIRDRFAPVEHTISLLRDQVAVDSPLYRFPLFGLLGLAVGAVALGIGRGALDEIKALAPGKTSAFGGAPLAQTSNTQSEIARGEAALRSARAFFYEAVDEAWATVEAGDPASIEERALLRLAAANAATAAVDAVDRAYLLGGGTSIFESSPLQRQFRDIHALTQHIVVSPGTFEMAGRVFLGLDPGTPMV